MAALTQSLQPHYVHMLNSLPPPLSFLSKKVRGDQLSVLPLVIALAAGWLLLSLFQRFQRQKAQPTSSCSRQGHCGECLATAEQRYAPCFYQLGGEVWGHLFHPPRDVGLCGCHCPGSCQGGHGDQVRTDCQQEDANGLANSDKRQVHGCLHRLRGGVPLNEEAAGGSPSRPKFSEK